MIRISQEAMRKWNQIPSDVQGKILSNVYCSHCRCMTTIVDFEAKVIVHGDLLLNGQCKVCNNKVSRLIENE
jgi:hypothetical protein